jgi:hypothetical protein
VRQVLGLGPLTRPHHTDDRFTHLGNNHRQR